MQKFDFALSPYTFRVRLLTVNCDYFTTYKICPEEGVEKYPTWRLYASGKNVSHFEGFLDADGIVKDALQMVCLCVAQCDCFTLFLLWFHLCGIF